MFPFPFIVKLALPARPFWRIDDPELVARKLVAVMVPAFGVTVPFPMLKFPTVMGEVFCRLPQAMLSGPLVAPSP